ncbi:MAG: hypothetical protein LBO69_01455 [Ignavibacteria bacterium]|jgi:hypothetical protein|nr:hypothetical protein [Ignavibacteria bacterium]
MAELSKVRVYGKAQNRTALGIANAYLLITPNATLEELNQAFPADLTNNISGNIFVNVKDKDNYKSAKDGNSQWELKFFTKEEELLTLADGSKVAFQMMWTKEYFDKLVEHSKQFGIEIGSFEARDRGAGKKGSFELEYLNSYVPPVQKQSGGKRIEQTSKKKVTIITTTAAAVVVVGVVSWFTWIPKIYNAYGDVQDIKENVEQIMGDSSQVGAVESQKEQTFDEFWIEFVASVGDVNKIIEYCEFPIKYMDDNVSKKQILSEEYNYLLGGLLDDRIKRLNAKNKYKYEWKKKTDTTSERFSTEITFYKDGSEYGFNEKDCYVLGVGFAGSGYDAEMDDWNGFETGYRYCFLLRNGKWKIVAIMVAG